MAIKKGAPTPGQLVLCTVKKISQFAAWCSLDEYNGAEGMIHVSEVAGKWIHDIKKYVKMEKQYVAKVIRIEDGNISLSLKRVSKSQERSKWNEFRQEQRSEGILKIIAKELGIDLNEAYEKIGFPLKEQFDSLYSGFEEIKNDPKVMDDLKLSARMKEGLLKIIEKSFIDKEFTIKIELQLSSYESDGVERIKKVLTGIEKDGIDVSYVSAPKYRLEIKTKNPKADSKKFEQKLDKVVAEAVKLNIDAKYNLEEKS
ncbi:MAG: S1 RNA-binding domain-containing protein [Candidatus Aenigmarchaeota archaeon]|nr:S1 RNA-binding domain-containing protein [Candidatus Aenigmarchaeota archaeon]